MYLSTKAGELQKGTAPAHGSPNYGLIVASTTARIDPARPICPLVGVRFTQARDGGDLTERLVRTPDQRQLSARKPRTLARKAAQRQLPPPTAHIRPNVDAEEVTHEHI